MSNLKEIFVPDIGDFKDVPIIDIPIKIGSVVKEEDTLITVESEKSTMDIPSPTSGVISEIRVSMGDKVNTGQLLVLIDSNLSGVTQATPPKDASAVPINTPPASPSPQASAPPNPQMTRSVVAEAAASAAAAVASFSAALSSPSSESTRTSPSQLSSNPSGTNNSHPAPPAMHGMAPPQPGQLPHASPSIRRLARSLGVDLNKVTGQGPKGRILQEDVENYVKHTLQQQNTPAPQAEAGRASKSTQEKTEEHSGISLLPWPKVDFAKFGPVERVPLGRIRKLSGANLARNWVMIPHVTQHDEADVTELEAFRKSSNQSASSSDVKLTMLAFVIKAVITALKKYPDFNASIDGEYLVHKKYYHIGFAADTPNGLVVPVIRNADQKGAMDIARELGTLSATARAGKLKPTEMQGAGFTISSLGGIGGTSFTPIINAPEVAILGLSKMQTRPVWSGKQFEPRLLLPLSLSYDHRVIDGAAAARFTAYLTVLLGDMRNALL